ncbi:MAG: cyclase family protein [Flavobacteriaceae bacterium]
MKRWKRRPEGSNWGEFGDDDQIGMMNTLTPKMRQAALAEAKEGIAFCLSLPLDYPGGSELVGFRTPPKLVAPIRTTGEVSFNYPASTHNPNAIDVISDESVELFSQYSTHWDGLAHWGQEFDIDDDGKREPVYYNGWRAGSDVEGPGHNHGPFAHRLSVASLAETSVQGRGVMVDLHALFGDQPKLVGHDDLMQALDRQKATVEPGDFLCLYTGYADMLLSMNKQPDAARLKKSCAMLDGRDAKLLKWITESGIVAICADNMGVEPVGYEAGPHTNRPHSIMPLHEHCLFKRGIFLGELWYLGELARWLSKRGRSRFLLTAPPLNMPGAVGSPLTPVGTV